MILVTIGGPKPDQGLTLPDRPDTAWCAQTAGFILEELSDTIDDPDEINRRIKDDHHPRSKTDPPLPGRLERQRKIEIVGAL